MGSEARPGHRRWIGLRQCAAVGVAATAAAVVRARRRIGLPPPLASALAFGVPATIAAGFSRSRGRDGAVWAAQMWAYKNAFEMPADREQHLKRRTHFDYPIAIDSRIGGGIPPSQRMARRLRQRGRLSALDKAVSFFYWTWEIEPHVVDRLDPLAPSRPIRGSGRAPGRYLRPDTGRILERADRAALVGLGEAGSHERRRATGDGRGGGHNGGRGPAPEFTKWAGADCARADLPTSHGIDTRDRAFQVQATAQELFAEATGAAQTMFSTNGSSLSVHVAIMSVVGPGDAIVMARNGHKSAFAGLILSGARPVYLDPYYDEELEIALGVLPDSVVRTLEAHPEAKAAMIFNPSYDGTSADVRAIADACHAHGLPLVTDDAWGLDYALSGHPELPDGALAQGSDLAIGSVHKTLSGQSQTSVLSIGSDRIDPERLQLCFELEESTSASGLLLSSIDGARAQFVREGHHLLDRAVGSARLLRERLAREVPELRVINTELLASRPGVTAVDPTHVLIETAPIGLTGYRALDWVREQHHIDVELVDHRRFMPLITFAHGEAAVRGSGAAGSG